ncbi:MAG: hypothetical protein KGJ44_07985, partial [Betaproteobacteria bacterium]|nr:hypothetical protein [Betaproteobacteria bacterium]
MNTPKVVKRAVLRAAAASAVLLVAAGVASAANVTVNLTAQRTSTTLPDGMTVPMWGYCTTGSTCASWAPGPTIKAAPGDSLTINLTNALPTPTSIVILGQLGGGLGAPTLAPSPAHPARPLTTWPAVSASTYTPPAQPDRARSFVPEAAAQLGTAAGTQSYTWAALQPGTYLYETGTQPSIQAPMGLYGLLVVTSAPTVTAATPTTPAAVTPGHAYPTVAYDADVSLLFSEIDPVQNAAVDAVAAKAIAAGTAIDTTKPSAAACAAVGGDATCYPPAVNYAPLYFLINGQAFDATQPLNFPVAAAASAAGPNGNVLLRMVNAGSRTHVPSVVGLQMALMAEDAHVPPGNPKVQSEVLLPAGKVFDVLVKPAQSAGAYTAASYAVFDRQLSLTTGNRLNGGMHGYLQVAGGATAGTVGNNVATAQAVNDVFTVPLNTASYSNNVLANDIGIKSAAVQNLPAHGTVTLGANGTFTYTATGTSVVPDTFSYCGNGTTTLCATVTLNVAASFAPPVAANQTYTSQVASLLKVVQPGVTAQASYVDTANVSHPYTNPVTAVLDTAGNTCGNVNLQPNGAFEALPSTTNPASCTFTYHLVNGQKVASNSATVTINFPAGNGIAFTVLESKTNAAFANSGDFQWVIEEDRTFHNPLATNTTTAIADTAALNFHASHMPLVA